MEPNKNIRNIGNMDDNNFIDEDKINNSVLLREVTNLSKKAKLSNKNHKDSFIKNENYNNKIEDLQFVNYVSDTEIDEYNNNNLEMNELDKKFESILCERNINKKNNRKNKKIIEDIENVDFIIDGNDIEFD